MKISPWFTHPQAIRGVHQWQLLVFQRGEALFGLFLLDCQVWGWWKEWGLRCRVNGLYFINKIQTKTTNQHRTRRINREQKRQVTREDRWGKINNNQETRWESTQSTGVGTRKTHDKPYVLTPNMTKTQTHGQ